MMSFWRFMIVIACIPMAAFIPSLLSIATQSWIPYVVLFSIISVIVWRFAKPRQSYDKSVSRERQVAARDWFIREVKKREQK